MAGFIENFKRGPTMRVEVVPHNSAWRAAFEMEAAEMAHVLGDLMVAVHHIGSTAIPAIVAKPIVDILVEVTAIERLDEKTPDLEGLAYEAMGEFGIPGRRYFRKADEAGVRTHQVHAFAAGSDQVARHLAFRDYMRSHPDDARAYGVLKQRLADQHPDDIDAYMGGKDAYIKELERTALAWRAAHVLVRTDER